MPMVASQVATVRIEVILGSIVRNEYSNFLCSLFYMCENS